MKGKTGLEKELTPPGSLCICFLAACIFFFTSCLSLSPGQSAQGQREEGQGPEAISIEEAEIILVRLKVQAGSRVDKAESQRLVERLATLRREKASDQTYAMRLYAVSGEAYLLSGDPVSAKDMLRRADDISGYGSRPMAVDPAPLLRVLLVPERKKRLSLMESSVKPVLWPQASGGVPPRLQCELGLLYMEEKRFKDALSLFDMALSRLPEGLREAYAPARESCFAYVQIGISEINASIAQAKPLSLGLMLQALSLESPALIQQEGEANPRSALAAYHEAGLLTKESGKDTGQSALRRDAVLPLFALYVQRGAPKTLASKYSVRYGVSPGMGLPRTGKSPVPDLAYESEIFDEALALVEREVMELPDGKNFMPERELSGLEFLEMLKKLSKVK